MRVELAYGTGSLPINLPDSRTTVINPSHAAGLADEQSSIENALISPIESAPLKSRIQPNDKVCILFTDITRATPNERIIPWLLEHLKDHPRENITLLNQLGTHRPNTTAELNEMLGEEVVKNFRVLNHDCENADGVKIPAQRAGHWFGVYKTPGLSPQRGLSDSVVPTGSVIG